MSSPVSPTTNNPSPAVQPPAADLSAKVAVAEKELRAQKIALAILSTLAGLVVLGAAATIAAWIIVPLELFAGLILAGAALLAIALAAYYLAVTVFKFKDAQQKLNTLKAQQT